MRGFVITGNERFLQSYTEGRRRTSELTDTLRVLHRRDAEVLATVDTVEARLGRWQDQVAEPEIALARQDLGAAREFVNDGLGPVLFEEFRAADDALRSAIDARSAQETSRRNRAFFIVVAAALSALSLLAVTAAALLGRLRRWVIELHTTEQRLRHTIDTIQASLLPPTLPFVDTLAIAVAYLPASTDTGVGGDFYDLMVTDEGMVNISIGDVSGHDIHAAVITSLVRHTLNAAGQHLDDPAEVLRWANKALAAQVEDGRFVTAAHGQFRPATETAPAVLHLALAGHPQPILIPANGGRPREIGEPGTLLGVAEVPTLTTTRTELAEGDQILLYTDGLNENSDPRLSTEELVALVASARGDTAEETAAQLLQRYEGLRLRSSRDDLAVLVLQVRVAAAVMTRSGGDAELDRLQPTQ